MYKNKIKEHQDSALHTYKASRHVEGLGGRVYDVVDGLHGEVECHELTHRPQPTLEEEHAVSHHFHYHHYHYHHHLHHPSTQIISSGVRNVPGENMWAW